MAKPHACCANQSTPSASQIIQSLTYVKLSSKHLWLTWFHMISFPSLFAWFPSFLYDRRHLPRSCRGRDLCKHHPRWSDEPGPCAVCERSGFTWLHYMASPVFISSEYRINGSRPSCKSLEMVCEPCGHTAMHGTKDLQTIYRNEAKVANARHDGREYTWLSFGIWVFASVESLLFGTASSCWTIAARRYILGIWQTINAWTAHWTNSKPDSNM